MVNFKNLPDRTTPVNAENLNKMQNDLKQDIEQLQNFYHVIGQLGQPNRYVVESWED